MSSELRVGVVGAGQMGADHIARVSRRISGASVAAVIEPDQERAAAAARQAPGAVAYVRIEDALDARAVDAVVVATPGRFHAPVLFPALEAGLPVLCEKPLAPDSAASEEILAREQRLDRPHIQVGFMRRFDHEYAALRELVGSGELGELLILHCAHRNPSIPSGGYTQEMLINDSVVHELDVVPWLAGSPIASVEVRYGRRNSLSPSHLREPIVVLIDLADGTLAEVEMNVSAQFGYQVTAEAVFERGVARIGETPGLRRWSAGQVAVREHESFTTRFAAAFDAQVQRWVDAVRAGALVDGPNAWDGYLAALACEAGVRALHGGGRAEVPATPRPGFYA